LVAFKTLVKSQGWVLLGKIAEIQRANRSVEVVNTVCKGTEDFLKEERAKGVIEGINLFMRLPVVLIESEREIAEAEEKLKNV